LFLVPTDTVCTVTYCLKDRTNQNLVSEVMVTVIHSKEVLNMSEVIVTVIHSSV
jgi:hypothetical protein